MSGHSSQDTVYDCEFSGIEDMAPPTKVRVVILTCSVVAIAVTGGWSGADLKISQEVRKVR